MVGSVFEGHIPQNAESGLKSLFNPIQGFVSKPPQVEAKDQVVFDEQVEEQRKAMEMAELLHKASRTKFATGNPDVDVRNYLYIKKIADQIMGLLE